MFCAVLRCRNNVNSLAEATVWANCLSNNTSDVCERIFPTIDGPLPFSGYKGVGTYK
jgi:hypothetical protein